MTSRGVESVGVRSPVEVSAPTGKRIAYGLSLTRYGDVGARAQDICRLCTGGFRMGRRNGLRTGSRPFETWTERLPEFAPFVRERWSTPNGIRLRLEANASHRVDAFSCLYPRHLFFVVGTGSNSKCGMDMRRHRPTTCERKNQRRPRSSHNQLVRGQTSMECLGR